MRGFDGQDVAMDVEDIVANFGGMESLKYFSSTEAMANIGPTYHDG